MCRTFVLQTCTEQIHYRVVDLFVAPAADDIFEQTRRWLRDYLRSKRTGVVLRQIDLPQTPKGRDCLSPATGNVSHCIMRNTVQCYQPTHSYRLHCCLGSCSGRPCSEFRIALHPGKTSVCKGLISHTTALHNYTQHRNVVFYFVGSRLVRRTDISVHRHLPSLKSWQVGEDRRRARMYRCAVAVTDKPGLKAGWQQNKKQFAPVIITRTQ